MPRKMLSAKAEEYDPATRFLFVPHTVTFLFMGVLALIYFSHPFDPQRRSPNAAIASNIGYSNAKAGVCAMFFVFLGEELKLYFLYSKIRRQKATFVQFNCVPGILDSIQCYYLKGSMILVSEMTRTIVVVIALHCIAGYSFVHGPTASIMVRPHPSFWRLIHGMLVCYLLFIVYLLFQNVDDARIFLKHFYPELGVNLGERKYGEDCRLVLPGGGINWPIIKDTVFDEFVVAHTLGWWGKALILRDNTMLWAVSILFELLELTFQHLLPNFNECWWDSWLLDVAICNWLGIATGMWTVRYFKSKEYNWRGISQQPNLLAKATRGLLQFTPHSFDDFQWQIFSSPKRCVQCLFPAAIILLFEINHFFLKYELWVPPINPLNTIRLSVLFLMALPGMKEYYDFIESDSSDVFQKVGPFAWLAMAIALAETLTVIKFGKGLFPQPWPRKVLVAWGSVGLLFAVIMTVWCVRFYILKSPPRLNGKQAPAQTTSSRGRKPEQKSRNRSRSRRSD